MRSDARRHRETLVAAAARVFTRDGGDAPLQAVLDEADLGRGTLYRHFADREALLVAVIEHVYAELSALFVEQRDSPDLLRNFLRAAARLKPPLQRLPANLDMERVAAMSGAVRQGFLVLQEQIVVAAIAADAVRPGVTSADIDLAISMIIGGGQVVGWPHDDAIEAAIDMVLRGLAER